MPGGCPGRPSCSVPAPTVGLAEIVGSIAKCIAALHLHGRRSTPRSSIAVYGRIHVIPSSVLSNSYVPASKIQLDYFHKPETTDENSHVPTNPSERLLVSWCPCCVASRATMWSTRGNRSKARTAPTRAPYAHAGPSERQPFSLRVVGGTCGSSPCQPNPTQPNPAWPPVATTYLAV